MSIEGWFGLPGMGKTYLMTRRAIKDMLQGYRVYANYPLRGAYRWRELAEVFEVRGPAKILIDEASLVVPAQAWAQIPFEVLANWRQHRHYGVDIYYTAQDRTEVVKALRTLTQFANKCSCLSLTHRPICFWWKRSSFDGRVKYGGGFTFYDPMVGEAYDTHDEGVAKQSFIKTGYGASVGKEAAPRIDLRA